MSGQTLFIFCLNMNSKANTFLPGVEIIQKIIPYVVIGMKPESE
jgi:hypothetical protein